MTFIVVAVSRSGSFKIWSEAPKSASNDDDHPAGGTAAALSVPSFADAEAAEQAGCPRIVPAVSISL